MEILLEYLFLFLNRYGNFISQSRIGQKFII